MPLPPPKAPCGASPSGAAAALQGRVLLTTHAFALFASEVEWNVVVAGIFLCNIPCCSENEKLAVDFTGDLGLMDPEVRHG